MNKTVMFMLIVGLSINTLAVHRIHQEDYQKEGQLIQAARKGNIKRVKAILNTKETAKVLLNSRASINAQDRHGKTALMAAVVGGHKEIVKLLLAKGADINAQDRGGQTALMHAAFCRNSCKREMVALLLDKGINVNTQDVLGFTALMTVALGLNRCPKALASDRKMMKLLLQHGANNRDTALRLARETGNKDMVKLLKKHGAIE